MAKRLENDTIDLGSTGASFLKMGAIVGAIGLAIALFGSFTTEMKLERFFLSYLVNFAFFLSPSIGALFFILTQHIGRAGWSVVVRRVSEGFAANVGLMLVLFIGVFLGMGQLYSWTNPEAFANDPILQGKQPYLNTQFFLIRILVYFGVWILLTQYFLRGSAKQDSTKDPKKTERMQMVSAPGIPLTAITVTFASFDLLMSRDPHWFSTIFGVYYFAGSFLGYFSLMAVFFCFLQSKGMLKETVTPDHYHDIGKYMFGFTVFWAYIAFSQFMLIWYGNIPEETVWYIRRFEGGWLNASYFLLIGHFIIPFFILLFREIKRIPAALAAVGVWILAMHWFDLYWIVMPESIKGHVGISWIDIACFIGMGGLYLAGFAFFMGRKSLIPEGDPRLEESLEFKNA